MSSNVVEKKPKFVYNSITINLDYPLVTNDFYETKVIRSDQVSISGVKQTAWDRNEQHKIIDIQFAASSTALALKTMHDDWASRGKTIDFYPNKDAASFDSVTIVENTFKIVRQEGGTNVWKLKFTIRKDL